jgi:hypothetical protein
MECKKRNGASTRRSGTSPRLQERELDRISPKVHGRLSKAGTGARPEENTLEFSVTKNLITNQLDLLETNRLMRKLPVEEHQKVTLSAIIKSIEELLDSDLDDCIK